MMHAFMKGAYHYKRTTLRSIKEWESVEENTTLPCNNLKEEKGVQTFVGSRRLLLIKRGGKKNRRNEHDKQGNSRPQRSAIFDSGKKS